MWWKVAYFFYKSSNVFHYSLSAAIMFKLLTAVVFFFLACVHANAKKTECYSLTDDEVRALYARWNAALQSRKSATVADQYWPQSALLPTISNTIRYNTKLKLAYFDDFLKKKPYGTVLEDYIDNKGCNYLCSGLHLFLAIYIIVPFYSVKGISVVYVYSTMASMTSGWQILLLMSTVSLTLASPMYSPRRMVKSGRFRPTTHHCYLRQTKLIAACVVKLRMMRNTSIHYSQHAKIYWRPTGWLQFWHCYQHSCQVDSRLIKLQNS